MIENRQNRRYVWVMEGCGSRKQAKGKEMGATKGHSSRKQALREIHGSNGGTFY